MHIHFCNVLIHIDWNQLNIRVFIRKYYKQLMRKSLSHPLHSLKIQQNFLKFLQSVTYTLSILFTILYYFMK